MAYRASGSCSVSRQAAAFFVSTGLAVNSFVSSSRVRATGTLKGGCGGMGTGIKRTVRAVLAGSLVFGGALTAVVIAGAPSASAASVVNTIAVGTEPDGISSDGTHVWVANESPHGERAKRLHRRGGPDHRRGR